MFVSQGNFCKNGFVSAINIFKMINSNVNLTILVHVHYCCLICFEAPSGFDNFEVHGGQHCCPICFEAPSGFNNYEVHGEYTCPICFEAPSGVVGLEIFFNLRGKFSTKSKGNVFLNSAQICANAANFSTEPVFLFRPFF
jgi:hypothetical protein